MKLNFKIAFLIGVPCWIVGLFVNPFAWVANSYNVTWNISKLILVGSVFWGIGFMLAGVMPFVYLYQSNIKIQDNPVEGEQKK